MTTLSIVIVNWNSKDQLRACLRSLPAAAAPLAEPHSIRSVIVVDNGSSDGSDTALDCGPLTLTVLRNSRNLGFAAACNQGARAAGSPDLLLFLNPDTLLHADSLRAPLEALDQPGNTRVGIIGIQLLDEAGQVARSCARFPTASQFLSQALALDRWRPALGQAMREWDHASTRLVDQVIGAFFLVRAQLFEQLGGFDERFFVYFEEVDLAKRARESGWDSLYLASVQAFHKGGGTSDQVKAHRLFYSLRSRLLYFDKHAGWGARLLARWVTWVLEPLARLAQLLLQRRWVEISDLARAYAWLAASSWRRTP
jgi:GT2 family glycosyltransferase